MGRSSLQRVGLEPRRNNRGLAERARGKGSSGIDLTCGRVARGRREWSLFHERGLNWMKSKLIDT